MSRASFSGVLTLTLEAAQIEEGQEIVLFQYDKHEGEFSSVQLVGCNVQGTLDYSETQLVFIVDYVACETIASSKIFVLV